MNKPILNILLLVLLVSVAGCKNKKNISGETAGAVQEQRQPLPPKYSMEYDHTVPPVRIDVEKTITGATPVNLSQVASGIDYYLVGDDKYPITDITATEEGFIILNQPKLYYYRKGMKRKRVGLKTEYSNWSGGDKIYFDKKTTSLYVYLKQINKETGYAEFQIIRLPPLSDVLARTLYLYPDSLPDRYFIQEKGSRLGGRMTTEFYLSEEKDPLGMPVKLSTHTLSGDTICTFRIPTESLEDRPETGGYYGKPIVYISYLFDGQLTLRSAFNDTVYRIRDENKLVPAYIVDPGKHRISARELFKGADRKNKAWMERMTENKQGVYINIFKENNSTRSGWATGNKEPEQPADERKVVHFKSSRQTVALPKQAQGMVNDLDGGMPFWPDGQTDGYLYMIRPAKVLKESVKLNGSTKQKELKAFIDTIDEKQNVLIVVK